MSVFGDIARLVRVAATMRRTGGLEPALEALGVSPTRRRVLWALATPLWPLGERGSETLPPIARGLSALGPSYVKFGQLLSTRPDIAGDALARDLRTLQDRLPPFSDAEARRMIAEEMGRPNDALFERLDPPIAAASIAQVHPAVTRAGKRVAVKVLRPGIERAFARDISAFHFIARLLERFRAKSRRLKPTTVVRHFEGVVSREMDLRMEAAAGSEYGENTRDEDGFRTPDIVWPLTSRRVLTTGWVDGLQLTDLAAIDAAGYDRKQLARRLMQVYLRSALRDGYFHADMHQGNLKLAPDGAIVAFDFGIMGRIDAATRRTYAEILFSYLTRDYRRGAQAHFDAGYVDRRHDPELFAQALRSIGEPIFGQQASEISMARLLQQLFDVTEQFGMETRAELILLQRTMVVVEGVARTLDPDFDMWETARPVVEQWVAQNLGPRAALRDLRETGRALGRIAPRLPELAERLVEMSEVWAHERVGAERMDETQRRRRGGFWRGAALGVGATVLGALLLGWATGDSLLTDAFAAFAAR